MKTQLNALIAHVLATLPDSVTGRRQLLEALLGVMPLNHPRRRETAQLLAHLLEHEELQRQAALHP